VRGRCPELREAIVLETTGTALLADGDACRRGRAGCAREAELQFDDPINIQYTSDDGFPKGRDPLATHNIPQQRPLHRETLGYTEADRVCVPVPFYHCSRDGHRQPSAACRAARASSCPVRPSTPLAVLENGRGRAVHVAVRRADDVRRPSIEHPRFAEFDLSSLRTA
jgi:fatty-acyl-CoA synthase